LKSLMAAAVLAVLATLGFARFQAGGVPAPVAERRTVEAVLADIEEVVTARGSLAPTRLVVVSSEISGRIVALKVRLNDRVKSGDVVAEMDQTDLKAAVNQAQNNVYNQQANLALFANQLSYAQALLDSYLVLRAKGYVTVPQVEEAQQRVQVETSNRNVFQSQLDNAKLRLEAARADLNKAFIRSPIDGIVGEMIGHQGEVVNVASGAAPILKLITTESMTVTALAPEADIMKVKPGARACFSLLGSPEREYCGVVKRRNLSPVGHSIAAPSESLRTEAVYYEVVFEAPNPDGVFLPAMSVDVRILGEAAKRVVTLPLAALGPERGDGRRSVKVQTQDGGLAERWIVTGLNDGRNVEVRQGLVAGERVVVPG
jgi:macrolide-specific efflux system membrane fusion protein